MDKLILNAYKYIQSSWMQTECRQIESREIGKSPPFFKKMLKGGTGLKVKFYKFTFWYTVEYFTSKQSKSKFIVLHASNC